MIAGFETATSGQIKIGERIVNDLKPADRNVAMAFEGYALYPPLTVKDNIAFSLMREKISKDKVDSKVMEVAELLEITDILERYPPSISGGQQQRVSLARALVRDSDALLLDEPMSQLEPQLRAVLRARVKDYIQHNKKTVISVTHDQTEALTFADQVVVMHEGQIVQTGTPVELFEKPRHTFVGHFIGSPGMNILPCKIDNGAISINGNKIETKIDIKDKSFSKTEVGIRPEFIEFNEKGLPVKILKVSNTGRHKIIDTESESGKIKVIAKSSDNIPTGSAFLNFKKDYTYVYGDNWIIE